MKKDTQKSLHTAGQAIVALVTLVNDFAGSDTEAFSGIGFQQTIHNLVKAIDKEVTHFLVASKPPALDTEVQALLPKITAGLFQLVQEFDHIPHSMGTTYLDEVRRRIKRALVAVVGLLNAFMEDKIKVDGKATVLEYTEAAGVFWEHAGPLLELPKSNREVVKVVWQNNVVGLVRDAADELKQSLEDLEEEEEEDELPETRREDAQKILKLVNLAKHLCLKISKTSISECNESDKKQALWLDRLLEMGKQVQVSVDDLVSTLFMDEEMEMEYTELSKFLGELVELAVTFVDDSQMEWFERCRKQLSVVKSSDVVM